MKRIKEVGE
jgi:hypothetical protein